MLSATQKLASHGTLMQRLGRQRGRLSRLAGIFIAAASLLILWQWLSIAIRPWVPSPLATWGAMLGNLQSPRFYDHLWLTLGRVLAAFAAATLIGSALGILIGLNRKAEAFFQPLLALALAVPDPVYIIFASVQARDTGLDEMVKIYRIPPRRAFWESLIPQLVPALLTAARFSFALSWKLVVVVESIGQPNGIGAAVFNAFRLLQMREVLAIAILFILLMQLIEHGVLKQVEKRLLRWRR
ncbi:MULTISPECIES: ABC transporter permease [Halomonadaceae]|uniref:ABC transporter permease n=1 Tax=Halomonadaceae TaxID=28256 RepID=UPI00159725BE|nr:MULTISPECIES: ABC transporter permease subunit [Halomonas]QJQ95668.1 ABC transporter permease subunit [Halomonas sp. PA5]